MSFGFKTATKAILGLCVFASTGAFAAEGKTLLDCDKPIDTSSARTQANDVSQLILCLTEVETGHQLTDSKNILSSQLEKLIKDIGLGNLTSHLGAKTETNINNILANSEALGKRAVDPAMDAARNALKIGRTSDEGFRIYGISAEGSNLKFTLIREKQVRTSSLTGLLAAGNIRYYRRSTAYNFSLPLNGGSIDGALVKHSSQTVRVTIDGDASFMKKYLKELLEAADAAHISLSHVASMSNTEIEALATFLRAVTDSTNSKRVFEESDIKSMIEDMAKHNAWIDQVTEGKSQETIWSTLSLIPSNQL